jgi:drug/metabolite transporter (DMT)-like permease
MPRKGSLVKRRAWLRLHLAVLLFGLAGLFGKLVHVSPVTLVFARTSFAALVLAGWLRLKPEPARTGPPRADARLWLTGVLLAFHWVAFFQAIQLSSVALALLTFSSFPVFVTFLEPVFFRERLRGRDLLTAAGVVAGLWLLVPGPEVGRPVAFGALYGLLSGLSFALLALVNRGLARAHSPVRIGAAQNLAAACVLLPLAAASGDRPGITDLLLMAVLGVLCTAVAHVLFIGSLSQLRAQVASVVTALEAVYGVVFAYFLLGEVPSARTLAGGSVILASVVLSGRRGAEPGEDDVSRRRSPG